jgi:hypothetical protein
MRRTNSLLTARMLRLPQKYSFRADHRLPVAARSGRLRAALNYPNAHRPGKNNRRGRKKYSPGRRC